VGVVTLWSRKDYVQDKFLEMGIDLDPQSSPIVAFGNLYGNGLKYLLANLLHNPQIRFVLVCGRNRSGSLEELQNFFSLGVEEYKSLGAIRNRIIGTRRTLDKGLTPELFKFPPRVRYVGDINDTDLEAKLKEFFDTLPQKKPGQDIWLHHSFQSENLERLKIELPEVEIRYFPSNPRSHTIVKSTPLEAWKELIFCIYRFGHPVQLKASKGTRQELQNVKVIVEKPCEEPKESLQRYGFSLEAFKEYQDDIVKGNIREDEDYNYGNRIRLHFEVDGLTECIKRLNKSSQDRGAFINLWDLKFDLITERSTPCLVTLFFRVFEDNLTLSATFRVHNAVDAWLQNFYGLMRIQQVVSEGIGIESGAITVISHSISINPAEYDRALKVVEERERKFEFEEDPNGQFRITVEEGKIVVRHLYDGEIIKEYKSRKAERIQYELNRDHAISNIGHAIYIGRQLAKAEQCLIIGEEFEEG
jgi:thymidylate synthase